MLQKCMLLSKVGQESTALVKGVVLPIEITVLKDVHYIDKPVMLKVAEMYWTLCMTEGHEKISIWYSCLCDGW